ncbi:hypothetical protein [Chitinophaga sp. 212800010-3]|uniref:hypothetical protein n=1 Tax=unclassified Chitinophaga TaxID=2619133 RepID=UPI002DE86247|nr:DUF2059 domain-containing protein [Chitinophaga sp. 212800010-3]
MKKIFLITILCLGMHQLLMAQNNTPSMAEAIKAGVKTTMARADLTRTFMQPVGITDAQKPTVNKLILDYMEAKRALALANRNNTAAYQSQQTTLFNTFRDNLANILSKEQMTRFLASKPAPDEISFLNALFY